MKNRALLIPLFAAATIGITVALLAAPKGTDQREDDPRSGPIRVLFLGHDSKHHNSNMFYPMLAKGLGLDG